MTKRCSGHFLLAQVPGDQSLGYGRNSSQATGVVIRNVYARLNHKLGSAMANASGFNRVGAKNSKGISKYDLFC